MNYRYFIYIVMSVLIISSCEECFIPSNEPGKLLWTHDLPDDTVSILGQRVLGNHSYPQMAIGLDGTIYYAASNPGFSWIQTRIYALNKEDGSLKWKTEKLDNVYMNSDITVADDGFIYVIGSYKLYKINPANGVFEWTWEAPEKIDNYPRHHPLTELAITNNGDLVTAGTAGSTVFCIDKDGNPKWANIDQQSPPVSFTIGKEGNIYYLARLFAPNWDGSWYLISADPNTGTKNWTIKTNGGIGGGNNIVVEEDGNLIASFIKAGSDQIELHRISPTGSILSSSPFKSDQHYIWLGPDGFIYQVLYPAGEYQGVYRIDPVTNGITLLKRKNNFGAIDDKNRLVYTFIDTTDNKTKLGAFFMDGVLDWKSETEVPGLDDRSFCISDKVIYGKVNDFQIIAIQSDASLASPGWAKIGHDNRNSHNSTK